MFHFFTLSFANLTLFYLSTKSGKDQGDRLKTISTEIENADLRFGQWMAGNLLGVTDALGLGEKSASDFAVAIKILGGGALQALPAVGGLVLAIQGIAPAISTASASIGISSLAMAGWVGAILAVVGAFAYLVYYLDTQGIPPKIEDFNNSMNESSQEILKLENEINGLNNVLSNLRTVYDINTSSNVLSKKQQEEYNKALQSSISIFPGLVSGIDSKTQKEQINIGVLQEAIKLEEDRVKLLEQIQYDKQLSQLDAIIDANEKYIQGVKDAKHDIEIYGRANQKVYGEDLSEARTKLLENEAGIRATNKALQDFIAQAFKVGNISDAFAYLRDQITLGKISAQQFNQVLSQVTNINSIAGLQGIASQFFGITGAILNSKEALAGFAKILDLMSQGRYGEAVIEGQKLLKELEEDKKDKPPTFKGSNPKKDKKDEVDNLDILIKKQDQRNKGLENEILFGTKKLDDKKKDIQLQIEELNTFNSFSSDKEKKLDQEEKIKNRLLDLDKQEFEVIKQIHDEIVNRIEAEKQLEIERKKIFDDAKNDEIDVQDKINKYIISRIKNEGIQKKAEIDNEYNLNLRNINKEFEAKLDANQKLFEEGKIEKFEQAELDKQAERNADRLRKISKSKQLTDIEDLTLKLKEDLATAVGNSFSQALGIVNQIAQLFGVTFADNSLIVKLQQAFGIVQSIVSLIKTLDTISNFVSALTGIAGLGKVLPGIAPRASGGSVSMNKPYLVGEQGAEYFFPFTNGFVLNSKATSLLQAFNNDILFNNSNSRLMGGLVTASPMAGSNGDVYIGSAVDGIEFFRVNDPKYREYLKFKKMS